MNRRWCEAILHYPNVLTLYAPLASLQIALLCRGKVSYPGPLPFLPRSSVGFWGLFRISKLPEIYRARGRVRTHALASSLGHMRPPGGSVSERIPFFAPGHAPPLRGLVGPTRSPRRDS